MNNRPSDSAIAQAFWNLTPNGDSDVPGAQLIGLAREIDAARPEQVQSKRIRHSCETDMLSDCPGCEAEHAEALQSNPRPEDPGKGAAALWALAEFTSYYVKNYPGPTTISDPSRHAPRIFRAAERAILRRLTADKPLGGRVIGARDDNGVHVIIAKPFYEALPDIELVRYDDYKALAANPQADQDRKDAARYRWLETHPQAINRSSPFHPKGEGIYTSSAGSFTTLGEAIDAAMAQEAEHPEVFAILPKVMRSLERQGKGARDGSR